MLLYKCIISSLLLLNIVKAQESDSADDISEDLLLDLLGGTNPPVVLDENGNVVTTDNVAAPVAPPTPPPSPPAAPEPSTEAPLVTTTVGEVVKSPVPVTQNLTKKDAKVFNSIKKKIEKNNMTPEEGLHELFETIFKKKKYDKNIRPNFQGPAVDVTVQVLINSFGPIVETTMDYKMDIFLRSFWHDKRLIYPADIYNIDHLNLDPSMIPNIWRPDIFFANAKKADFHKVTRDNHMMQLYPDGSITQSVRISLTLDCPMNLEYYPLDEQVCSVYLESFAFPIQDLKFIWRDNGFILPQNQRSTAQVRIIDWDLEDCTKHYADTGNFTCVVARIHLKREIGYYMIGTFIPTILIVVLSWISFWINPLAAPARVALGITTVLTMTTKASSIRANLPKVSYVKAIDVWMLGCMMFVFTALLQYAYVNFIIRLKRHYSFVCKTCVDEMDTEKLEEVRKSNFRIAKRYDVICRALFPIAFAIFNITFWAYYLNTNSFDFKRCMEDEGCIIM